MNLLKSGFCGIAVACALALLTADAKAHERGHLRGHGRGFRLAADRDGDRAVCAGKDQDAAHLPGSLHVDSGTPRDSVIPDLGFQLLFLIETSCRDDPDYLALDDCFDPDDAFNPDRCSYENPDICRNVALCFPEEAPASPLFLVADEEVFGKGDPPNYFNNNELNHDDVKLAQRTPLEFFAANVGYTLTVHTGEVGDEGFFALTQIPRKWHKAGPTDDGLRNYVGHPTQPYPHSVGKGLGTGGNPEKRLDKVKGVTPLRATGLAMLVGHTVCAVVYDSDVSVNYDPMDGNLQGSTQGTVAFRVLDVRKLNGYSSSSLPKMEIEILDPALCEEPLVLFEEPPALKSSSEPFDIDPAGVEPMPAPPAEGSGTAGELPAICSFMLPG